MTVPAESDFDELGVSGFVAETVDELRAEAAADTEQSGTAADALRLLVQLSGGVR